MKISKLTELAKTRWKNGQGLTTEIAIDPADSNFSEEKFIWRLSCAEVKGANSFSQFMGYDRSLIVWQGDGILLNSKKLDPFVPYNFHGEDRISCELVNSAVQDLGIIFRRGKVQSELKVILGNDNEKKIVRCLKDQITFLFVAEGTVEINKLKINSGEILKFSDNEMIELTFLKDRKCIIIEISILPI